eukprot:CAMPEP_0169251676 /NCGR_PEP_ID=MMETSP1016-20121227/37644_1 /TAXON_ID=342587 /ORGANISM="Karlodinium micrum, Strain CCMP2283" /LENGTH=536 /DNA_ID=CAMNT_0009332837 /DNA_START=80 /DNA_END=1687 /DNA_ORIENTATION=-
MTTAQAYDCCFDDGPLPAEESKCWWKVRDGLLIGSRDLSEDRYWHSYLAELKVTRVVNCAGCTIHELPCLQPEDYVESQDPVTEGNPARSQGFPLTYLTYDWFDNDSQTILDEHDEAIENIFSFIEATLDALEGVLVQSEYGQSRSCCVVAAYLMKKFRWCLQKTMDFLGYCRPGHKLQATFMRQLASYEQRLRAKSPNSCLSLGWDDINSMSVEESMLRATYLNSRGKILEQFTEAQKKVASRAPKVRWLDNSSVFAPKSALEKPAGADRHNAVRCERDEKGNLVLISAMKNGVRKSAVSDSQARMFPTSRSSMRPTSSPSCSLMDKQRGARVHRFLLRFEPPALAVEWSTSLTDDSMSKSLTASNSLSAKTCTHIDFTLDDLTDPCALAARVVHEQAFLSTRHASRVEKLLQQLSSQVLPVYRVTALRGIALRDQLGSAIDWERASILPSGALVLATQKVKQIDGWWIRAWTGQWLQATCIDFGEVEVFAEQCEPSESEVQGWLREAALSRRTLLLDNARLVAKQCGTDLGGDI